MLTGGGLLINSATNKSGLKLYMLNEVLHAVISIDYFPPSILRMITHISSMSQYRRSSAPASSSTLSGIPMVEVVEGEEEHH